MPVTRQRPSVISGKADNVPSLTTSLQAVARPTCPFDRLRDGRVLSITTATNSDRRQAYCSPFHRNADEMRLKRSACDWGINTADVAMTGSVVFLQMRFNGFLHRWTFKARIKCDAKNVGATIMRKLFDAIAALSVLLTTLMSANAADVPPYAPPVAPPVYVPPPFSWTGFYIGLNLGRAWSQRNRPDPLLGLSLSNVNDRGAFIGGGQLGYNYQFGNFVLGVEADFDGVASTNSPGTGVVGPAFGTIQVTSDNRWIATLAG